MFTTYQLVHRVKNERFWVIPWSPRTGLVIADTMRETFGYTWAFPHASKTWRDREDEATPMGKKSRESDMTSGNLLHSY
jgi:hypothetical protein